MPEMVYARLKTELFLRLLYLKLNPKKLCQIVSQSAKDQNNFPVPRRFHLIPFFFKKKWPYTSIRLPPMYSNLPEIIFQL